MGEEGTLGGWIVRSDRAASLSFQALSRLADKRCVKPDRGEGKAGFFRAAPEAVRGHEMPATPSPRTARGWGLIRGYSVAWRCGVQGRGGRAGSRCEKRVLSVDRL